MRACAYQFLYGVAKSTYWRRPKPETFGLFEQIITFHSILALYTTFFLQYHTRMSFLLNPTDVGQKDTQKQVFQLKI